MALTPKQARFVDEYLIDLNATQAAIRAGYSAATALQQGPRLLGNVGVQAAISARQADRSERTEITQDRVLAELWAIATADPNDLIQFRRGACLKCWSVGPDANEQLEPQAHGGALKRKQRLLIDPLTIDEDPNPECPECGGEGVGRAWIADTRKLKGAAGKLYAGVKVTKDGFEVKMHDKAAALVNVGKHLGMFKDRVEHTGADGGPIKTEGRVDVSGLTPEQLRALASVRLPTDA
jgi:phage terminase small subunit